MTESLFQWIIISGMVLNTGLVFLVLRSLVILLQDIRSNGENTVMWLREIAGNSLEDTTEDI